MSAIHFDRPDHQVEVWLDTEKSEVQNGLVIGFGRTRREAVLSALADLHRAIADLLEDESLKGGV